MRTIILRSSFPASDPPTDSDDFHTSCSTGDDGVVLTDTIWTRPRFDDFLFLTVGTFPSFTQFTSLNRQFLLKRLPLAERSSSSRPPADSPEVRMSRLRFYDVEESLCRYTSLELTVPDGVPTFCIANNGHAIAYPFLSSGEICLVTISRRAGHRLRRRILPEHVSRSVFFRFPEGRDRHLSEQLAADGGDCRGVSIAFTCDCAKLLLSLSHMTFMFDMETRMQIFRVFNNGSYEPQPTLLLHPKVPSILGIVKEQEPWDHVFFQYRVVAADGEEEEDEWTDIHHSRQFTQLDIYAKYRDLHCGREEWLMKWSNDGRLLAGFCGNDTFIVSELSSSEDGSYKLESLEWGWSIPSLLRLVPLAGINPEEYRDSNCVVEWWFVQSVRSPNGRACQNFGPEASCVVVIFASTDSDRPVSENLGSLVIDIEAQRVATYPHPEEDGDFGEEASMSVDSGLELVVRYPTASDWAEVRRKPVLALGGSDGRKQIPFDCFLGVVSFLSWKCIVTKIELVCHDLRNNYFIWWVAYDAKFVLPLPSGENPKQALLEREWRERRVDFLHDGDWVDCER